MKEKIKQSSQNIKEFSNVIKREIKELKKYKKLIIIAIIFAVIGTFLSVISPNLLSELIDEIGIELKINYDNLEKIVEETEDIDDEFELDGTVISVEEQEKFRNAIGDVENISNDEKIYTKVDLMPENIQKLIMPKMDMEKIIHMTITLVIIYVLSAVCMYVQAEKMADVTNGFSKDLRTRISKKINHLNFRYFDKHSLGDILSKTTNDTDTIAQSMNQAFENLFSSIILVIGTVIMMFITNWIMALTAIITTILGIILVKEILVKSQKYFISRQKELGELNEHIEETYSNMKYVRVYNGTDDAIEEFNRLNKKVYNANRKSQFLSGMMQPVMEFMGNFGYVAVCIVGAILTMNGMASFGMIIAFITYVKLFTSPLTQIAQSMTFLQSATAASHRIFEFLDEKELASEDEINTELLKEDVKGDIEFKNVEFRYFYTRNIILKDVSFNVKSGEKVGIIGPIGVGKTTLMKVLLRFNRYDAGDIKIDGMSIKNIKRENIHRICTCVFQEPWIFAGTVKENIIYNRKNLSEDRIEEVCKALNIDDFVKELPKGYDTKISDKSNLSAGEKQLIAIARGILEETPTLILDEATSNLDDEMEKKVFEAIERISKAKTVIVISHRESIKRYVDRVLELKDGVMYEK